MERLDKERLRAEIGEGIEPAGYSSLSGLYFFLSLDLVNSTAYKAENDDWNRLTRGFYDDAKNFWSNHEVGSFKPVVWKYAGDEVLFYCRLNSADELIQAVEASYRAVQRVSQTVQTWTKNAGTRLFVKGTSWAAEATYAPPSALDSGGPSVRNLLLQSYLGEQDAQILDFLGPEIDAGFRISQGSMKNALVVSAEVADFMWSRAKREVANRLRVVGYRQLKGVWHGRHYPFVWYRTDWTPESLSSDYQYDDRFKNKFLSGAYAALPNSMDSLRGILTDVGKSWLSNAFSEPTPAASQSELAIATLRPAPMEVHCVAICFAADGRVLLAKRPATKSSHPGCWEFGCAQLKPDEDFQSAMRRDYRSDFGIELEFDRFEGRNCVGWYHFTKNSKTVPGMIFAAVAKGTDLHVAKHEKAEWVAPSALETWAEPLVPRLIEHVRRAQELFAATAPKSTQ